MEIAGYFTDKRLAKLVQVIKEFRVSSIKFVERPRAHADAIGQRVLDLVDGDLWFGLKLDVLGHIVFLRRAGSPA